MKYFFIYTLIISALGYSLLSTAENTVTNRADVIAQQLGE